MEMMMAKRNKPVYVLHVISPGTEQIIVSRRMRDITEEMAILTLTTPNLVYAKTDSVKAVNVALKGGVAMWWEAFDSGMYRVTKAWHQPQ